MISVLLVRAGLFPSQQCTEKYEYCTHLPPVLIIFRTNFESHLVFSFTLKLLVELEFWSLRARRAQLYLYRNSIRAVSWDVYTNCFDMVLGTFSSLLGANSRTMCVACQIGKFQSSNGSVACNNCQSGTYIFDAGMSACAACSLSAGSPSKALKSVGAESGQYFTGGLGKKATSNLTSWWCLPLPCAPSPDLACFKYDRQAKVFILWGRNSQLALVSTIQNPWKPHSTQCTNKSREFDGNVEGDYNKIKRWQGVSRKIKKWSKRLK